MKHKLLNRIGLVVALLLVGFYFLQNKINSPEECQKTAGIWNEHTQNCEHTTAQIIYENLSAGYPIIMTYPETDIQVKIDKVETVNETYYLRGHYQKVLKQATADKEAVYDRGSLYLNMSKMVILSEQVDGVVFYVAPFIMNTAGSGVFVYVGLFSYEMNSKQSVHLDSALVGDRIREEKITHINNHLQIDFKDYAQGQALSDYPSQDNAIYLLFDDDNFKMVNRMHNSWDANNDGINDCESDGSCDHTINYNLPRAKQ